MGYRIDYQPVRKLHRMHRRRSGWSALAGGCVLAFLAIAGILYQDGKAALQELLFSGDAAVTAAAMEELVYQLGQGAALKEALSGFCRRILEGAGFAIY